MKSLKKKKINITQSISEQKKIGTTQDFKNNFIIIKEPVLKKVKQTKCLCTSKSERQVRIINYQL